jgi:DNA-binding NtrC family response regulator
MDIVAQNAPRRVLVVDDEGLIRWSVTEKLAECGLDVREASDGAQAIRALADPANSPDVVLLDYRLPDSNDLTLLSKVRQMAPGAAVIMMTAYGAPDMFDRAVAMGVYCVLAKPFDVGELPGLIRKAFDRRPTKPGTFQP